MSRSRAAARITPEPIAVLREASPGVAWLVAERNPPREILDVAAEPGVRCFVLRGGRFHALARPRARRRMTPRARSTRIPLPLLENSRCSPR